MYTRSFNLDRHVKTSHDVELGGEQPASRSNRKRRYSDIATSDEESKDQSESSNESDSTSKAVTSSDDEGSDDENFNDSTLTIGEVQRVRHAVAWAELGEHSLSKKQLKSLVKEFSSNSNSDENSSDDSADAQDYAVMENETNIDTDDDTEVGKVALAFLREMFNAIDADEFEPPRSLFFEIVDNIP